MTLFGESYVDLFGMDRLLSCPAAFVRRVSNRCVSVQLTASPPATDDDWARFNAVRDDVKQHLGSNAFFDPKLPEDHEYVIPQFRIENSSQDVVASFYFDLATVIRSSTAAWERRTKDGANDIDWNRVLIDDTTAYCTEAIREALAHGANPNQVDDQGNPPLIRLAQWNLLESMRLLLAAGADVNAYGKRVGFIRVLADRDERITPLIAAASQLDDYPRSSKGVPEALRLLVDAGADVNARSTRGRTALSYAIELLERRLDHGRTDQHAQAALQLLRRAGGSITGNEFRATVPRPASVETIDDAEWHYTSPEFPKGVRKYQAFVHTGFYLGWLIERNMISDEFREEDFERTVERFLNREITGPRVFEIHVGNLFNTDLTDEARAFTQEYYLGGQYFTDLQAACGDTLYCIEDNWENYASVRDRVDSALAEWRKKQKDLPYH
ncbi:MAG: ankyrin repeat domain-containing protein [Capsulimonadaceae bacterium]